MYNLNAFVIDYTNSSPSRNLGSLIYSWKLWILFHLWKGLFSPGTNPTWTSSVLPQTKPIFGIQNTSCCGITNAAVTLMPNLKKILNSKGDASEPLLNIWYLEQLGIQDWITPPYSYNFSYPNYLGLILLSFTWLMKTIRWVPIMHEINKCNLFLVEYFYLYPCCQLWICSIFGFTPWHEKRLLPRTVQSGRGSATWN